MALLTLQDVSKHFGGIKAVDGVSFTVDRGQVVGFLGPNGAGKSTTMRIINQYLEPDAGTIEFDGQPLWEASLEAKGEVTATCRGVFVAVREGHPAYHRW